MFSRGKVLFVIVMLFLGGGLLAQSLADSSDPFYAQVQRWEVKGYVADLPPMMPYPLTTIRRLLEEVIDSSAPAFEKGIAERYLSRISEPVEVRFGSFLDGRVNTGEGFVATGFALEYAGYFSDEVSLTGRWTGFGLDASEEGYTPYYEPATYDVFVDNANLDLLGRELQLRQEFFNNMAYDGEDFYFQMGLMSLALGSDLGSVILGGEQYHAPTMNFQYDLDWSEVGITYMSLTATDYLGQGAFGDKHLVMHNYAFHPFDWLSFNAYEVNVWGERFDLTYFIPFTFLFYNQSFTGFGDNSLLGGSMEVTLPGDVFWSTELFIDDASLNKIIRLDFANAKAKIAGQTSFTWYSDLEFLPKLKLGYLAITPYTYSQVADRFSPLLSRHGDIKNDLDGDDMDGNNLTYSDYEDEILSRANYLNYTHYGRSLGTQLNPNSDQISLLAQLHLLPRLGLGIDSRLIRHGNPNEGLTNNDWRVGGGSLDGTIFDDGFDDNYYETFDNETRFLTQSVLETVWSTDLELSYAFMLGQWSIHTSAGVLVEMIWNDNFQEGDHYTKAFGYGTIGAVYVF